MSQDIKTLFINCINKGLEAAADLAPEKKATVLAEYAKAMAMTGLINVKDNLNMSEVKSNLTDCQEGIDLSHYSDKLPSGDDMPEEETTDNMASTEEDVAEWTDANLEKYSDEVTEFEQLKEEYGIETINTAIEGFSEGLMVNGVEDVTPANIVPLLAYIKDLIAETV